MCIPSTIKIPTLELLNYSVIFFISIFHFNTQIWLSKISILSLKC